jgi:DNA primase
MSKLAPTSIKYIIKAKIKAKGVIEKPDVIGAVFGQTEGLLGSDMDLRELQRTGKIGRIEVNIKSVQGNSEGEIIIPSSLDAAETALIASTLETIERVGPCTAEITLESVEDTRSEKRRFVVEKAQEILKGLAESGATDVNEVSEQIKEAVRTQEISNYHGLPAGPSIEESDEIIIVEGRADILNLLRYGIKNTIAVEGTSIPQAVVELAREKSSTLFIDGDRGGSLIAKEIMQKTEIDYVARAPEGKEVEELTKKEAFKALRDRIPAGHFKTVPGSDRPAQKPMHREGRSFRERERGNDRFGRFGGRRESRYGERREGRYMERHEHAVRVTPKQKELFRKTLDELVGTRAACIFNEKSEPLGKVPVSELVNALRTMENPYAVIFDGRIDFRLNSLARMKGIKFLVGMEKEDMRSSVALLCRKDLEA